MCDLEKPIVDTTSPSPILENSSVVETTVSNIVEQTLVELVKKSLENEDMKNKITIQLSSEVINVINNIISLTPEVMIDIEKAILEIIKDGKIDSNDIPNLIVVIQRIYLLIYSYKNVKLDAKKRTFITATSLKYIIHLLVLERKIKIDEDRQADFFTQIDILIESCVGLLSYSKSLKTKGCLKKLLNN